MQTHPLFLLDEYGQPLPERLHEALGSWVARQDNIPRGRTIPMGAVPVEARGLWHMAPTYLRRRPGSPSNGRLGSALRAIDGFFGSAIGL